MFIMLIKQSTSSKLSHYERSHCCLTRLLGDDVYLQHPHMEPMAFYHACGFLQAVSKIFTGIELHPKTIADTLLDKVG